MASIPVEAFCIQCCSVCFGTAPILWCPSSRGLAGFPFAVNPSLMLNHKTTSDNNWQAPESDPISIFPSLGLLNLVADLHNVHAITAGRISCGSCQVVAAESKKIGTSWVSQLISVCVLTDHILPVPPVCRLIELRIPPVCARPVSQPRSAQSLALSEPWQSAHPMQGSSFAES